MTKIAEQWFLDGKSLIQKETHDYNPVLNKAASLRSSGAGVQGESRMVAVVPDHLAYQWAREAGVKPDDPAFGDVIAKKLADPDNALFRVWGGKY